MRTPLASSVRTPDPCSIRTLLLSSIRTQVASSLQILLIDYNKHQDIQTPLTRAHVRATACSICFFYLSLLTTGYNFYDLFMSFHLSCVMFFYSWYGDRVYFYAVWIRYSLLFYSLSKDTECFPSVWTSCHCLDISPDRLCLSAIMLTSGWAGLGEPGPVSWFLLDMRRTIDMLSTIMLSTTCHVIVMHLSRGSQ